MGRVTGTNGRSLSYAMRRSGIVTARAAKTSQFGGSRGLEQFAFALAHANCSKPLVVEHLHAIRWVHLIAICFDDYKTVQIIVFYKQFTS
jgi:hypothetical protein